PALVRQRRRERSRGMHVALVGVEEQVGHVGVAAVVVHLEAPRLALAVARDRPAVDGGTGGALVGGRAGDVGRVHAPLLVLGDAGGAGAEETRARAVVDARRSRLTRASEADGARGAARGRGARLPAVGSAAAAEAEAADPALEVERARRGLAEHAASDRADARQQVAAARGPHRAPCLVPAERVAKRLRIGATELRAEVAAVAR